MTNRTDAVGGRGVRNLIGTDTIDEPVKRFLSGLDVSTEASVVEVNGRRVYLVVRPAAAADAADGPWTDALAHRRHGLIDRKIDATLGPLEAVELAELEEQFDRHLGRVAPLPIEYARDVLARLRTKVAPAAGTP